MFDIKKYKELIKERMNTDWEQKIEEIWNKLIKMITIDDDTFNEFIEYMKTDMTGMEYAYLSEISDEISEIKASKEFAVVYRKLSFKYPVETKKYFIESFIKVAEAWAEDEK